MKNSKSWSRRKFSKAAVSMQMLLSAGLLNASIGCTTEETKIAGVNDAVFRDTLKHVMDEIIPKSGPMPTPSSIGGVEYIIEVLKNYPELVNPMLQIVTELDNLSHQKFKNCLVILTHSDKIAILKEYEIAQPEWFNVLKTFVYEAYYTNKEVWDLIGYEPHPTLSAGPEMEPFDKQLLKRVQKLPPSYLDPDN